MNFQILIVVCMIAVLTKQVESEAQTSAMLWHIHKYYPVFNGTCLYVECLASTKGASYDCQRTYVSDNQKVISSATQVNLKATEEDSDTYSISQDGQDLGLIGTFKFEGDLVIYNRRNKEGKVVEVLCGSYSSEIDVAKKEELSKICVFEGVEIQDVDNAGCLKKITSISG